MRVTQSMLFRQTMSSLNQNMADAVRLQDQLSSGVRLNQAKDDPSAMTRVMRNDDRNLQLQRFAQNIENLDSRLGLIDDQMGQVTDNLHRARELFISGANGSQTPESLAAIALELRSLGENVFGIAAARDGQGRYLFSGTNDGQAPFSGDPTAAVYEGGANVRQVPVDDGMFVDDGLRGDAVFQGGPAGDLFQMFNDLADILETPTPDEPSRLARLADIEQGFDRLDLALGHVVGVRATLGKDMQRLDLAGQRIDLVQGELAQDSSRLRDTDYAAAVSSLAQEMTALDVARQTFTRIQGLSLFDFLR